MNILNILYWDSGISVGAKVGRGSNIRVDSDADSEFGSSDGEGVELKFVY